MEWNKKGKKIDETINYHHNIGLIDRSLSKDIPIEISIRMLEPLQLPKNGLLSVNRYIMNRIENVATIPETSSHNAL